MSNWRGVLRMVALAFAGHVAVVAAGPDHLPQTTLDGLFTAYAAGDHGVVQRQLNRSQDFQVLRLAERRRIDNWLQRWEPVRAAMILEMARRASVVAPAYTPPLLAAGQRYLLRHSRPPGATAAHEDFVRLWHRIALAIIERRHMSDEIDRYVDAVHPGPGTNGGAVDPRLLLARAIAQEQRCHGTHPTLTRAGTPVASIERAAANRSERPRPMMSDTERRLACLDEAATRFDAAAAANETRAEARVRAGWVLFQLGRLPEAMTSLAAVEAADDAELRYWAALFRGRVASALGRPADAEAAYREALSLFPNAQSAGVGLVLALVDLDRPEEADAAARAVRGGTAQAPDPWWTYINADDRFITRWIDRLRQVIQ